MWDTAELLIVLLAHVGMLLPSIVLADHYRLDAFLDQECDDALTCRMHVVLDTTVPPGGETLHAARTATMPVLFLQFCTPPIVVLVDGLHWTPVNDYWDKPRFV